MKFPALTTAVLTISHQSFQVRASMQSAPSFQNQVPKNVYSSTHTNAQLESNESGFASSSSDDSEDNDLLSEDNDDDDEEEEEEEEEEGENDDDTDDDEYDDNDNDVEIPSETEQDASSINIDATSSQSQPLKTLKKLQAMLEETDYATATTTSSNGFHHSSTATHVSSGILNSETQSSGIKHVERNYHEQKPVQQSQMQQAQIKKAAPLPPPVEQEMEEEQQREVEQLWTSKDRSKYKKQRKLQMVRDIQRQRMKYLEQQEQQMHAQSDDESHGTDGTEDTDDGLGYTLPNLPVYFSDAESTDDVEYDLMSEKPSMSSGVATGYQAAPPQVKPVQGPHNQIQQNQLHQSKVGNQNGALQQYDPNAQRSPPRQQGQSPPYQYQNNIKHQSQPGQQQQQQYPSQPQQQQHQQQQYPLQPQQQQQQPQQQQHQPQQYPLQPQQQQQHQQQYYQQQPQQPQSQIPQGQQIPQNQNQNRQQGPSQGPAPYNYPHPPPYVYNSPNAYNSMSAHQQYMNQMQQHQQYQAYSPNQAEYSDPNPPQHYYQSQQPQPQYQQQQQQPQQQQQQQHLQHQQQQQHRQQDSSRTFAPQTIMPTPPQRTETTLVSGMETINTHNNGNENANVPTAQAQTSNTMIAQPQNTERRTKAMTLAEAGALVTFDAMQKIATFFMGTFLLCYCAVSPRTLELADYNLYFRKNIQRVMLTLIVPAITLLLVVEVKENDFNSLVNTFHASATLGYTLSFLLEIFFTTVIRLGVFWIWEPSIFSLTPTVPLIILPWTLRDHNYRPKRITLFTADFVTTCIAAPIIEEYMKLKVLELSTKLPHNYRWKKVQKNNLNSNKKKKKKRRKHTLEAVERKQGETPVTNINSYVSHMLAASLGIKLCDATRRILMYTKHGHEHKSFYAFFRGFFPIHELCGCMTALELAKRDVLGLDTPLWKMLLPAVGVHGIANLKGMKPIFKWNSVSPWTELQLSPWYIRDDRPPAQLFTKGLTKLMWLIIMGRVLGYCIKNYYMIGRMAIKRTTTFAQKNASFSAEMHTSELLKKTKKEK